MTPQVSKKDHNLISMLVLAETLGRSVVEMIDEKLKLSDKFSQNKIDFYNEIKATVVPFTNTATQINSSINDEYLKIFSASEMDVLMDSVIFVIDLLERQDANQIKELMKVAGWRGHEAFFEKR